MESSPNHASGSTSSTSNSPASTHSISINIRDSRRELSSSSLGQRSTSQHTHGMLHSASTTTLQINGKHHDDENNNTLGFTSLVGLVKSMSTPHIHSSLPDLPILVEKMNDDHNSDDELEMKSLVSNGTNGHTKEIMHSPHLSHPRQYPPFCCPESISEHWNFALVHSTYEWRLIKYHKWILMLAIIWQYVHKVATNVAYYLHEPAPKPLYDLGFAFIPALPRQLQILSEILFFMLFLSTFAFCAMPFIKCVSPNANPKSKTPLFAAQIMARYCAVLVMAQTLRSISFLVTLLPGPNYHCRSDPNNHDYNPPKTLYVILTRMDAFFGCGDLVFSSHTIFVIMCALTITKYAPIARWKVIILWIFVVIFGFFVVAARKHYTLDIVVALYTVPLLWIAYEKYFPDYIPPDLFVNLPSEIQDRDRSITSVE